MGSLKGRRVGRGDFASVISLKELQTSATSLTLTAKGIEQKLS